MSTENVSNEEKGNGVLADVRLSLPSDSAVFEWLQKKNFQTEMCDTGEYRMYFGIDMPEIIRQAIQELYVGNGA